MNAKELHDALQGDTCPWWVISDKQLQDTILRALSLLAAAEANDGKTPETDAEAFDAIRIAVGRTIDLSVVSADFARLLERERNGFAAEVLRLKMLLRNNVPWVRIDA